MWEKGRRCRRGVILQLRNRKSKKRLRDHFHCRSRKESRANTSHLSSAAEKTDTPVDVKAFVNWLLGWITSATERLLLFLYDCQIPPTEATGNEFIPLTTSVCSLAMKVPLMHRMSHVERNKQPCHHDVLFIQRRRVNIHSRMKHTQRWNDLLSLSWILCTSQNMLKWHLIALSRCRINATEMSIYGTVQISSTLNNDYVKVAHAKLSFILFFGGFCPP